jgi:LPS-assembly lipoprotein
VLSRTLLASTSYNVLSSQFTTRVSEDDARLNALNDLARQAEQQIVLYFERSNK